MAEQFYLVKKDVLPSIFEKVVNARTLLELGQVKSLSEAANAVGISRSVLYKYKDSVFVYDEENSKRILTIHLKLRDKPGVLSACLALFYESGMNILTLNQSIPTDSVALVTVSGKMSGIDTEAENLLEKLKEIPGVVSAKLPLRK